MAGIYDADISSNTFCSNTPKDYDFYKKEKSRLLQPIRFGHLQRVHWIWLKGQFVRGRNPPQRSKSENQWLEKGAIDATQVLQSVHVCIKSNILEGKKLCICKRTCKINRRNG